MKIEDIRRILIIGAGTMGQEIGLQCARYGYEVILYDLTPKILEAATTRQQKILERLVRAGQLTPTQAQTTLTRIATTPDPNEAAQDVDLINESVPEILELKTDVFAQFNELCPQRTIFTTNTSYLLPSMMAAATGRPAQFAAFHFHHEVWVSNVVDIMPHPGTAEEIVELLYALAGRIGQIPIVCKMEHPGYIFNAMLGVLNGMAITLAANGIAPVEDIDRAWMGVMKTPIGPFGILDSVGLDTVWHIIKNLVKTTDDPQVRRNSDYLKRFVEQGHLGVKTGRGFYTYPTPAYQQADFVTGK